MTEQERNELAVKCEAVFDFFGNKIKEFDIEIKQTERKLKRLKKEREQSNDCIEVYKSIQGDVFGA